jgi:hypothetical protein
VNVAQWGGSNIAAPAIAGEPVVTLDATQAAYAPAKAGNAMTLADDAITAGKFDESTAFPVKSADTGATQIARVGADSDTLETLSDQIDGLPTDADVNAACDTAITDAALATAAELLKVKGITGYKKIINAAGTQVKLYSTAGALLITLDKTVDGGGIVTWTPTEA